MENIIDLASYFEKIISEYKGRNGEYINRPLFFQFGIDEFVLDSQNAQVTYPLVWLEVPDASPDDTTGGDTKRYTFSLVVLSESPADNQDLEKNALLVTEQIADDLMSRLRRDSESNLFKVDFSKCGREAILNYSGDNLWGWRINLNLMTYDVCYCFDENYWSI